MPGSIGNDLAGFLQGELAVNHQFAGIDAEQLCRAVFDAQARVHGIHLLHERLFCLVCRTGGQDKGNGEKQ